MGEPSETARCERCGKTFAVAKDHYGHLARCPHCHKIVPAVHWVLGPQTTGPAVVCQCSEFSDGGQFDLPIVGESHYLSALEGLDAGRRRLGLAVEFDAYLIHDHENAYDPNATAVYAVDHGQIGYLSREDAVEYREAMNALEKVRRFPGCKAKLIGGTPGKPNLGVLLDLPDPDALMSTARELANVPVDRG